MGNLELSVFSVPRHSLCGARHTFQSRVSINIPVSGVSALEFGQAQTQYHQLPHFSVLPVALYSLPRYSLLP